MYPNVLLRTVQKDYTSGQETSTENLSFDFYNGQPTHVLTTNAQGDRTLSVSRAAYREYSGMGLGVNGGANMLTQGHKTFTFKIPDGHSSVGIKDFYDPAYSTMSSEAQANLLSASVQTWNDKWPYWEWSPTDGDLIRTVAEGDPHPVWRKQSGYVWTSPASHPSSNTAQGVRDAFVPFPEDGALPTDPRWVQTSEITLYDRYSNALEVRSPFTRVSTDSDLTGSYAATRMGVHSELPVASVAGAPYAHFTHSSFEEDTLRVDLSSGSPVPAGYAEGDVYFDFVLSGMRRAARTDLKAHTGKWSLAIHGDRAQTWPHFELKQPARGLYRVSAWSSSGQGAFETNATGTVLTSRVEGQVGEWYLCTADIAVRNSGEASLTVSYRPPSAPGTVTYLDDFRVFPIEAAVSAYTYDEYGQVEYMLDANNFYTRFEYDDTGRLVATYQETLDKGEVKIAEYGYQYKRQD